MAEDSKKDDKSTETGTQAASQGPAADSGQPGRAGPAPGTGMPAAKPEAGGPARAEVGTGPASGSTGAGSKVPPVGAPAAAPAGPAATEPPKAAPRPEAKETPKPDAKPEAKDPPKASAAGAAPPPPSKPPKQKTGGSGFAWTVLILLIIGAGGYFTWPKWSPYVMPYLEPYLPEIAKAPEEDSSVVTVEDRLAALEQDRERLDAQLAAAVARVEGLEKALAGVSSAGGAPGAGEAAGDLMQRLSELESRTDSLAGEIDARIGTLESSAAVASGSSSSAAVLAVSQLRNAAEGGGSFAAELEALTAVVGSDDRFAEAVAALEPLAAEGTPTVADLANRFPAVAANVVSAEAGLDGDTWMVQAANQLMSLVTVRRTGTRAAAAGGAEAAVARAEELLAGGDLAGAVDALSGLEGAAAEAAAAWTDAAQARLAVEAAVATLQVRAVALVSAQDE